MQGYACIKIFLSLIYFMIDLPQRLPPILKYANV
jgi:hypothetical protein